MKSENIAAQEAIARETMLEIGKLPPAPWTSVGEKACTQRILSDIRRATTAEVRLNNKIAAATAHRACCGSEHDPANGKLHGLCVVCGTEWPCETAKIFIGAESDSEKLSPADITYGG